MQMPDAEDVGRQNAVREAVCAERWNQANARLTRIEAVMGAIVLLLLLGEGRVVSVIKRLVGQ